ncbi:MAG TPA: ion channel [Streptosporangiaceae bacterium]|nr:ion channel [Streptosporangiaceae bacterium]
MLAILVRLFGPHHRKHIAVLLASAAGCVLAGAGAFAATQQLPFSTGLYWAITSATTVGYGDVTPRNAVGRLIASLVMLTTIPLLATVFALASGDVATAGIRRILAMRSHFPEGRYRLVIGLNDAVPAILAELAAAAIPVVLVADADEASVPLEVHLIRGDPTDETVLKSAKPEGAEQALITGQSDGDVLVSAVLVRKLAPGLETAALVSSPAVREALTDLGVHQVISAHTLIASALAKSLEAPHAGDMLAELVGSDRHRLSEVEAAANTVGRPLSAVRDERDDLVLGLVHNGKFMLGVGDDPVVQAGDRLLLAVAERAGHPPARRREPEGVH